jgi:hypothetical protein
MKDNVKIFCAKRFKKFKFLYLDDSLGKHFEILNKCENGEFNVLHCKKIRPRVKFFEYVCGFVCSLVPVNTTLGCQN